MLMRAKSITNYYCQSCKFPNTEYANVVESYIQYYAKKSKEYKIIYSLGNAVCFLAVASIAILSAFSITEPYRWIITVIAVGFLVIRFLLELGNFYPKSIVYVQKRDELMRIQREYPVMKYSENEYVQKIEEVIRDE